MREPAGPVQGCRGVMTAEPPDGGAHFILRIEKIAGCGIVSRCYLNGRRALDPVSHATPAAHPPAARAGRGRHRPADRLHPDPGDAPAPAQRQAEAGVGGGRGERQPRATRAHAHRAGVRRADAPRRRPATGRRALARRDDRPRVGGRDPPLARLGRRAPLFHAVHDPHGHVGRAVVLLGHATERAALADAGRGRARRRHRLAHDRAAAGPRPHAAAALAGGVQRDPAARAARGRRLPVRRRAAAGGAGAEAGTPNEIRARAACPGTPRASSRDHGAVGCGSILENRELTQTSSPRTRHARPTLPLLRIDE